MIIKAFIHHKRAEKYSDCQDCFGINAQNNLIAVSDGISQSIFPQWWAKILVEYFLENGHIPKDILPLQAKWQKMLFNEIQRREEEALTNPQRDPWRLKNLLAESSGAGATLCGLSLGDKEWICECLGDSCVITINHDYTLKIYTSQDGDFSNCPDYYDSFKTGRGEPIIKAIDKDVRAILMVTDPFAELFQLHENNPDFIKSRFEELQRLTNHESFIELVEKWRDEFGMHNDDSTLVLITDCSDNNLTIAYSDDLEQLCIDEKNTKNILLEDAKTVNVTNNNIAQVQPLEDQHPKEAIDNFISSFIELMAYYRDKKSIGKIFKWVKSILKPIIDSYCKS